MDIATIPPMEQVCTTTPIMPPAPRVVQKAVMPLLYIANYAPVNAQHVWTYQQNVQTAAVENTYTTTDVLINAQRNINL